MDINAFRAATPAAPIPPPTSHSRSSTPAPAYARTGRETPPDEVLAWCLTQYEARHGPLPAVGGRNHWLTALGYFCNERGVPLTELESHALNSYAAQDFEVREITQTLHGIYAREAAAHGSKPYTAAGNKPGFAEYSAQKENRAGKQLPATFPAGVYDALPDYLRRCCEPFDGHERAVMLLGTLAVLSGCFPAVGGTYNKRRFGLNLFAFIIAPAASGKGTLAWARRLAWPYHKELTDASHAARAEYDAELAAYKSAGKAKASLSPPPDAPPPHKLLYLPGNTTAAALATALAENDGRGIMCETEADTLSGALGADFGNFSDVLRKAFQHEPVSLLRKTDRQHLDLARPALSIALTGTPGQLPRLMPTAEDGLVSRFLFYTFAQAPAWQDVSPSAGPPLDPYFDTLAGELTRMIKAAPVPDEAGAYPVEIVLSMSDWQRLNAAGAAGLTDATAHGGGAGASQAFRLGLIAFRVAGLLTVLRCFENGQAPADRLECDPADMGTALAIMDTARAHALAVLATLPSPGGAAVGGKFTAKAEQETRVRELHAEGLSVRDIAEQVGIHYSTVSRWLNLP
ncbi:DUF3987 domain-containing protein [Hymenobacter terrenus]|uniref:DUF3987 domain-containing protein n=1 Tax=Hymenobacter terrenus TaxID=1629124 RepID=UPI000696A299|nr:DUF3987 domain-containing protein [Hymenobacter terrenus]